MNLLEMYERARGAEIIPVAATVLPYNTASTREASKIRELNRWIRNKTKNLSIPFCDTNGAVADSENPDRLRASPDGLHPDVGISRHGCPDRRSDRATFVSALQKPNPATRRLADWRSPQSLSADAKTTKLSALFMRQKNCFTKLTT